ncbi:hypothetical protein GGX14DRAFT_582296 [Mycena pura]|uniref:beta-glucosidase n=1 Tax=Mycena pura TaxID=153505 RepID=A0AAD6YV14_9AGAR|nr:hypothetical protein GGX14DRAFT_582296 [Mycena pura]
MLNAINTGEYRSTESPELGMHRCVTKPSRLSCPAYIAHCPLYVRVWQWHDRAPSTLPSSIDSTHQLAGPRRVLPGQESGNAIVDVLFADSVQATNPSGRLPYTIAKASGDYPADILRILGGMFADSVQATNPSGRLPYTIAKARGDYPADILDAKPVARPQGSGQCTVFRKTTGHAHREIYDMNEPVFGSLNRSARVFRPSQTKTGIMLDRFFMTVRAKSRIETSISAFDSVAALYNHKRTDVCVNNSEQAFAVTDRELSNETQGSILFARHVVSDTVNAFFCCNVASAVTGARFSGCSICLLFQEQAGQAFKFPAKIFQDLRILRKAINMAHTAINKQRTQCLIYRTALTDGNVRTIKPVITLVVYGMSRGYLYCNGWTPKNQPLADDNSPDMAPPSPSYFNAELHIVQTFLTPAATASTIADGLVTLSPRRLSDDVAANMS